MAPLLMVLSQPQHRPPAMTVQSGVGQPWASSTLFIPLPPQQLSGIFEGYLQKRNTGFGKLNKGLQNPGSGQKPGQCSLIFFCILILFAVFLQSGADVRYRVPVLAGDCSCLLPPGCCGDNKVSFKLGFHSLIHPCVSPWPGCCAR